MVKSKKVLLKKMDGIVVSSSTKVKPFLTNKKIYEKHGFGVVDFAPPYFDLLALKINNNVPLPQFTDNAKQEWICNYFFKAVFF